ncbi:hypothetical protein BC937DRAFT_91657, partial [Endogone sp. FLAS-F59071]
MEPLHNTQSVPPSLVRFVPRLDLQWHR